MAWEAKQWWVQGIKRITVKLDIGIKMHWADFGGAEQG